MTEEMNTEHLPAGTLYERLRADEAALKSDRHLESCVECRRRLAWLLQMRETGPAELQNEPPDTSLNRVLRLATASKDRNTVMRWLMADVVFDSFTKLRSLGVRNHELRARHIVYRAGPIDFNVDLQRAKDYRFAMIGQVNAGEQERVSGIDVWLQCNERLLTTLTDELGEFMFSGLPATEYRLTILLENGSVMLPPFSMPSRS